MRLHALSLTAFGPFPGRVDLDLDDVARDGLFLLWGPTGAGKTTLLYGALRELPAGELNVMTVEDPIEYELPGLTQMQVEPKQDVTFANALRSILRQDPDVIFIGEIRDPESALSAIQAAETGHLVISTLHTIDCVETINRLLDLFPPSQQREVRSSFAGSLRGIVAQRLVQRADGKGRVPAVEVLVNTGRVFDRIVDPDETDSIPEVIAEGDYYGMQTFDQALVQLVKEGLVAEDEARRTSTNPHDFDLALMGVMDRRSSTRTSTVPTI